MDDLISLMIKEASKSLRYAYAPYSHYRVAACICSEERRLFTGVNVENCSYGLTMCAEMSAIGQLISAGQRHIRHIVIMAGDNKLCTPCGSCRQCINEFSTNETQIHLCTSETVLKTSTIDELLPLPFNFKNTVKS